MNNVLPFTPKIIAGDWTASERARLLDLADHLSGHGGPVEVAFGQTDAGDPWCVVTDARQEVLVHVARIDGQFVVHDASVNVFRKVSSLWGAVRQVVAVGEGSDVVVAFNPPGREAQSFLSLLIAVGLYLELQGLEGGEGWRWRLEGLPQDDRWAQPLTPSGLLAALGHDVEQAIVERRDAIGDLAAPTSSAAARASQTGDAIASPEALSAPDVFTASPSDAGRPGDSGAETSPQAMASLGAEIPAGRILTGDSGEDRLIGGAGADVISGGGGDDYLDGAGAPAGQVDQLDGGVGDDRIVMGAQVVATGGSGADSFIVARASAGDQTVSLGVVLDFSAPQGDRLVFDVREPVTVVSAAVVADVRAESGPSAVTSVAVSGTRVGFDFNNDGAEDAFVLLGGAAVSAFVLGVIRAGAEAGATIALVGQESQPPASTLFG